VLKGLPNSGSILEPLR